MSDLLPPNASQFEHHFSAAFSRISNVPCPARSFNLPFAAPSVVLPWLAWEKSVDNWQKYWSEKQRRQVLSNAYFIHCHKGTIGALDRALDSLGFTIKVQEWFNMQPQGQPYTFKIHIQVGQIGVTQVEMKNLMQVIQKNKNLRSHLIDTTVTVRSNSELSAVSALCAGNEFEYALSAGGLYLDGTWSLDGSKKLNGVNL